MNTGYKEMLRDRLPKTVSAALRFCKAKEAYLNHVYKNFIWIYSSKAERDAATRRILGLRKNKPSFYVFSDTLDWENMSKEERDRWTYVEKIVSFFTEKSMYAKNAYEISKESGSSYVELKLEIINRYLKQFCPTTLDDEETRRKKNKMVNQLADFLIDYFEEND